ncbi:hypothetical protein [Acidihalobacter ferrooxydans]|uniref:Uncharacterized protein n=1 Tax=Acidihalobacter ferrooxydans TaxID=1765967 RepID=A0A1P8UHC2_9GAMM|nr:hypothetical protein [Acidihalobacter ferrooxydans]APZ43174.1 hypothetical protein BW247_08785 [Acidihalobacter ferrooxydans]
MLEISIHFPEDFATNPRASVRLEGDELPEYGQVWIWDMFYAQTAHAIADTAALHDLREDLELWGVNMSSKVFQPFEHIRSKGHLVLREGFAIDDTVAGDTVLSLGVTAVAKEMPRVELRSGDTLSPELRTAAVVALAQYFIDLNELFAKELPLHILAFRKFYGDVVPPGDPSSIDDAPMFAIQKALEYFNSAAQGAHH